MRTAKGNVSTFDVPSAGTGAIQGTVPLSLNPERAVAGFHLDGNSAFHGFLRSPRGKLTTFDIPGAGGGAYQGTIPYGNNTAGTITGAYVDANGASHGFLRLADREGHER